MMTASVDGTPTETKSRYGLDLDNLLMRKALTGEKPSGMNVEKRASLRVSIDKETESRHIQTA